MRLLIIASVALLFAGTPAEAGPVAAAAVAISGAFKAITATAIGSFLVNAALSAGLSLLARALQGKQRTEAVGVQIPGTTVGENVSQTVTLGTRATGGHLVYRNSHGNAGRTPNAFLTEVIELSDVPRVPLIEVIIDDRRCSLGGPVHPEYGAELVELRNGNSARAWIKYYDGTQTTADPMLVSRYSNVAGYEWSNDHIGTGTAYAILTYRYDREIFQQPPRALFVLGGMPLYDPRLDSTVGGEGPQRWHDPGTWQPTGNTAVQVYNVLRGLPLPTGEIYGGGTSPDDIPLANAVAGMNICDALIGGRPQFQTSAEINVAESQPAEVIEALLAGSLGQIAETGGVWRTRFGPPAAPSFAFTAGDVSISDPQSFDPIRGLEATFNAIVSTYVEPADLWQPRTTEVLRNATWEAEDGGRLLISNLQIAAVTNRNQARQVQDAMIADERRQRQHGLVLPPDAQMIDPLDDVSYTDPRWGYQDKDFEAVATLFRVQTGMVQVTLRERDPDDYLWTGAQEQALPPIFAVLPPRPPQPVTGFGVVAHEITDGINPRRPALRLTWDFEDIDDVDLVGWQVRLAATQDVVAEGVAALRDGKVDVAQGIVPAAAYQARARYIADRPTEWTGWLGAVAPDIRIDDADLSEPLQARIQSALDDASAAGQTAQEAFTAAQDAADAVATLDQQLLDDLAQLVADLDGLDAEDVIDARRRSLLALRDGWVKDPTFQEWTGGNLSANNWADRSGVATYGTQDAENGLYGSSLLVSRGAVTGSIIVAADNDTGLIGADPLAEYVVVTLLVDIMSGNLSDMRARAEWRQGSGAWQRGHGLGQTASLGLFSDWGFAVRPGVIQGKQVLFRRPAGAWDKVRVRFQPGAGSDAVNVRTHVLNIRAATEAEIATWQNAQDIAAEVTTRTTQVTGLTNALASLDTQVNSRIGDAESNISNLQTTKVDAAGAVAAVNNTISAQNGGTVATVSQRATTAVNRTNEIYARAFLGASTSDGATASLELIAFNAGTGGSSASAIVLNGDNIIANGTLSTPKLVVTDFTGNLVPDPVFGNALNAYWSAPAGWDTIARNGNSHNAVQNAPAPFLLRIPDQGTGGSTSTGPTMGLGFFTCKPGEKFQLSMQTAGGGGGAYFDCRLIIRFFTADQAGYNVRGAVGAGGVYRDLTAVRTSTAWVTYTGEVTAPAGAAWARMEIRRVNSPSNSGIGHVTNLEVIRKRSGSVLIEPESITAPLLTTGQLLTTSAQIGEATVETLNIGQNQVTFTAAADFPDRLDFVQSDFPDYVPPLPGPGNPYQADPPITIMQEIGSLSFFSTGRPVLITAGAIVRGFVDVNAFPPASKEWFVSLALAEGDNRIRAYRSIVFMGPSHLVFSTSSVFTLPVGVSDIRLMFYSRPFDLEPDDTLVVQRRYITALEVKR